MNKSTIVDQESNRRVPHDVTLMVVLDQLRAAGIDFTAEVVRIREWPLKPYVPVGIRQKEVRSVPAPLANPRAKSIKTLVSWRTGKKL